MGIPIKKAAKRKTESSNDALLSFASGSGLVETRENLAKEEAAKVELFHHLDEQVCLTQIF